MMQNLMRLRIGLVCVLLLAACDSETTEERPATRAAPTRAQPTGDIDAAGLTAVRGHLDCAAQQFYCGALDRFQRGSAPAATEEAYSVVGRGYDSWEGEEEVNWFVARPGESMLFGDVVGGNPAQLRQVLETLKRGNEPPRRHPLMNFVRGLATGGDPPNATEARGQSRYYLQTEPIRADVFVRQNGSEIIVVRKNPEGAGVGVFRRPSA